MVIAEISYEKDGLSVLGHLVKAVHTYLHMTLPAMWCIYAVNIVIISLFSDKLRYKQSSGKQDYVFLAMGLMSHILKLNCGILVIYLFCEYGDNISIVYYTTAMLHPTAD